ncbi:MAG: acyl-phosphate glycerol 3-phosphate acyltransferase [Beggiatoa sp. IS2]|nr:MAG: acyl-phosphate glycerol 3-phosphate acyltransferase [Beggiatoa sp. IS2]
MEMLVLLGSFLAIGGYLLGSFSSAVVVSRLMELPDPRTQGSGNPGATNVLRLGGKKAALITLVLDILKGVLAVFIARWLTVSPDILASVVFAVFLGHLFPIFFAFQGGKGVATAFGAFLVLSWPVALTALVIWLTVALLFRYSSAASLMAAALTPLAMFWFTTEWIYILINFLMSLLLIWRHRSNIRNLIAGTEIKIGAKPTINHE